MISDENILIFLYFVFFIFFLLVHLSIIFRLILRRKKIRTSLQYAMLLARNYAEREFFI